MGKFNDYTRTMGIESAEEVDESLVRRFVDEGLTHQKGSFMATVAAGPVFRLLGAKDLGTDDDYKNVRMPAVNSGLLTVSSHGANMMAATRTDQTGSTSFPGRTNF